MGLERVVASADSCFSVSSVVEDQVGRPGHCSGPWRLATPSALPRRKIYDLQSDSSCSPDEHHVSSRQSKTFQLAPRALHTWEPLLSLR